MVCPCCAGTEFEQFFVVSDELARTWDLSDADRAVIDRQQGLVCSACRATLRSMALAAAVTATVGWDGTFRDFVRSRRARRLEVLEINEAGTLSPLLAQMPHHTLAAYPEVDMTALPYEDACFDLVVHSDTLEHVGDPVQGLRECRRVLAPGGACCFTVPIVPGRVTRRRDGLEDSFHGDDRSGPYLVRTEYGVDAWLDVLAAGFPACAIRAFDVPAGLAVVAMTT